MGVAVDEIGHSEALEPRVVGMNMAAVEAGGLEDAHSICKHGFQGKGSEDKQEDLVSTDGGEENEKAKQYALEGLGIVGGGHLKIVEHKLEDRA